MLNRAYSVLNVKGVEEDQRIIIGTATTPEPDRIGDIVEPLGISYKNPLPLLHHHKSDQPVGTVVFDKPTKDGITFKAKLPQISEPGPLKDRVDTAWLELRTGLVRGVSIGFRAKEHARLDTGGLRFTKSEVLELSLVTVPANAEATIQIVKSIDTAQRAATGQRAPHRVVHLNPPGASGRSQPIALEGKDMKTIAEQITQLEQKRAASASRMEAIQSKAMEDDRTKDAGEKEEFGNLRDEVNAIDDELVDLRALEKAKAFAAKAVTKVETQRDGAEARSSIIVKQQPKLAPGLAFARMVKCMALSHKQYRPAVDIARELYGPDSIVVGELTTKAPVPAGTTITGNWAANLVGEETGAVADFVEYLRPQTILGRFGNGGVPALRNVMFRTPLITQTGGGAAYWTGEGKAKGLTSFDFTRTTMEPTKCANIAVLTEESIRSSSPKSDVIVRESLAAALRERLDIDFITPANGGTPSIKPASITNGAETIASSGDDADDVRLDIRSVYAKYASFNNPPSSGVWIMGSNTAVALAMLQNPLGQAEFAGMSMTGGTLNGMPVIASDYVTDIVALVNTSDIYLADDGEIAIDASREASLEMADVPAHNSITPTGASLVSMWQTNSVAIRAERTINWMRRRDPAVVYLTGVSWGGEVNTA
jgi:HK97 family phage major capsid protein/HK97 family phage prohead protease